MTAELRALGRPSLLKAICLRCPYCGESRLLKKKAWFEFEDGCRKCDFRYEREVGYFTGASWMINFPVTSVLAFGLVVALLQWSQLRSTALAAVISAFVFGFGLTFFPLSQSIWLVVEHLFNPLKDEDRLT